MRAPDVLSVIRNPEEVSDFVRRLKECFEKQKPVWVVLRHVKEIDYDGITVLLSVVVRFKSKQIAFNGDLPADSKVRATLQASRFFHYLYHSEFQDQDTYVLSGKSSILTHAMRQVDSELGEKLIASASQTVWGEQRRCPGVQRTFIELMQNTNNHASLTQEGEKHWWLSVKHVKSQHRVAFSFVDYGVGVFVNLRNKPQNSKFYGVFEKLNERIRYGNNAEILKLILRGDLHMTASGQPYRGKGLPGIYEALSLNKLSNFVLLTNDVFFDSRTDEYRVLKTEFQGTFVYWELKQSNWSLPHAA